MNIGYIALVTLAIWLVVIQEFLKNENDQNSKKIIILSSAGTLLTLVLTISLFSQPLS